MNVAILTFDGFNELDTFTALGIFNKIQDPDWNIQITSPTKTITSIDGLTIQSHQPLSFANTADIVLLGSGIYSRDITKDKSMLSEIKLDETSQVIGAQCGSNCSGTLLMAEFGLLNNLYSLSKAQEKNASNAWIISTESEEQYQPFFAPKNIATASGSMAPHYLATWAIEKVAGKEVATSALSYIAPMSEKINFVNRYIQSLEPQFTFG